MPYVLLNLRFNIKIKYLNANLNFLSLWNKKDITQFNFRLRKAKQVMSIYEFIISVFLIIEQFYSAIVIQPLRSRGFPPALSDIEILVVFQKVCWH